MIGRIFLMIIVSALSFIISNFSKKKEIICKNIFASLLVVLLSVFYSLRVYLFNYKVTGDYKEYYLWFKYTSFENFSTTFGNIGFDILISIFKLFSNNFNVFIFLCGIVIFFGVCSYVNKTASNFTASMILFVSFCFDSSMNIMRQWMACAIFLYAFKYIHQKRLIKYLFFCLVAAMFHNSALLMVVLYPFTNWNIKLQNKIFLSVSIGVVVMLGYSKLIYYLLFFASKFGVNYAEKYLGFGNIDLGNYTPFCIAVVSATITTLLYKKCRLTENQTICLPHMYMAIATTMLNPVDIVFNRISVYTFVSSIVAIPNVSKFFEAKQNSRKIIIVIMCVLFSIKFILN